MTDLKEKLYKEEEIAFPQGKIILLDGRELKCFPRKEGDCKKGDRNNLEFDTTGRYLSFGKKRTRSKDCVENIWLFLEKQLFIENAFLLLQNKELILQDSRMFLASVAIESGLAYTGTSGFRNPTVGVYLECWNVCKGALRADENGVRSLVYRLAGSPLSSANRCALIREDGKEEIVNLRPFSDYWLPFIKINQHYSEAKPWYEAFTLKQVVEMLQR